MLSFSPHFILNAKVQKTIETKVKLHVFYIAIDYYDDFSLFLF